MDKRALICFGLLLIPFTVAITVALVRRYRSSRCPQCGQAGARSSGPIYPHGTERNRPATVHYRCEHCGHTWTETIDQPS